MSAIKDAIAFIRQSPSILYSLFLMILIPVALFFYAFFVITSFQQILDVEISKKAQTIVPMVQTFAEEIDRNPSILQDESLKNVQEGNNIVDIMYLRPTADGFRIISSFDEKNIGSVVTDFQYNQAWSDTRSFRRQIIDTHTNKPFWELTQMVRDSQKQRIGLVSVLLDVNASFGNVRSITTVSYMVLIGTVLVLILFVANNARLIQQAYLFEQIKELDKQKDEFISIAAHELRTPVTSIKGFLSNISDGTYGKLTKKVQGAVDRTLQSTTKLHQLVEDLLEVSRIERGIEVSPEALDPNENVRDTIERLATDAQAKDVTIESHLDAQQQIYVDEERYMEIVTNLISNSIKYTPKGTVTVTVTDQGNTVALTVEDDGIGIAATDQEELFHKFHRVKSDETQKLPGTGLGLWITKQLVEIMGGTIKLESIKDKGSKFIVTFPAVAQNGVKKRKKFKARTAAQAELAALKSKDSASAEPKSSKQMDSAKK